MTLSEPKAFTLIETLVTIVVFTLMMGAISTFIVRGYRSYNYMLQQAIAISEAKKGIRIMTKEIREARPGDDGSFPIEKAQDKEFIFYSDIDGDNATERVRYFLGSINSNSDTQECVTYNTGGFCDVLFSGFLTGALQSAEVHVSVEGDFGWSQEYGEVFVDGMKVGEICNSGCSDCAASWEGSQVFDVTTQATDDLVQVTVDASGEVDPLCDWQQNNHSMKVRVALSWVENVSEASHEFKKGVIEPTTNPVQYPTDQETVETISSYVRNSPPVFKYFNENGEEITQTPARLRDTKVMELFLIINVNPQRVPEQFELKSSVKLRNINTE